MPAQFSRKTVWPVRDTVPPVASSAEMPIWQAFPPAPDGVDGAGRRRPLVVAKGVTKRFPGVVANDGIDLTLWAGEVHGILGENGAGKTTLMNVLCGMLRPDAGVIEAGGQAVAFRSPRDALARGIAAVYQHFALVPGLSVLENVVLGATGGFWLKTGAAERAVERMLRAFGIPCNPRTPVRYLPMGQQQRVEIIKALYRGSRVLLLDEPTSVLAPPEVQGLFEILRELKARGTAVAFITHKLDEVLQVSDRITILRAGRKVGELPPEVLAQTPREELIRRIVSLMFGTGDAPGLPRPAETADRPAAEGRPMLALEDITCLDDRRAPAVRGLTLALSAGEIVGIAGVAGSGQKELAEVIAGQRVPLRGRVVIDGVDITRQGAAAAARAGVSYLTDDRMGEGCIGELTVAENLAMKRIRYAPFARHQLLDYDAIEAHAIRLIDAFSIKTRGPRDRAATLSGGNVQKLLLARELSANPRVLVCNNPTQGVDLQTAIRIREAIRATARQGAAVLLISADLDELFELSDRVGVMFEGRLLAVLTQAELNRDRVGRLMLGVQTL